MATKRFKHGDIVRFTSPEEGEVDERMVVREDRGDRVLVAHLNSGEVPSISAQSTEDLTRTQSVATGLANMFSSRLCGYLTSEQISQVNIDNLKESGEPLICHSHDYIDANEVMAEAWKSLFGVDIDLQNDEMCRLWGDAWTAAKSAGFRPISEEEES